MRANFHVTCPYCGFENRVSSDSKIVFETILRCNVDEGGCDEVFCYKAKVDLLISTEVYSLNLHSFTKNDQPGEP